ncbi:MAG: HD domain-containing phosphohydrolase [Acidobacteriota bacterium]
MDRILVVDDSPVVCAMLASWLSGAGYQVALAYTGEEAMALATTAEPSLVLLDLMLPDVSGVEVCRQLKDNEATTRIPVVVLTSAGSSANRIHCLELGAEDFLTKPVVHEELLARVRSLLRAKHLSDRLLISFLELDKLGTFAEAFTSQIISDWSAIEVASSIARHLLGTQPNAANHPQMTWAAQRVRSRMLGFAWYYEGNEWQRQPTLCSVEQLREALGPFDKGQGQYVSKTEPAAELCELLRLPGRGAVRNFAAVWAGDDIVLAASYPWEVGAYELPLLRAVLRHWAVFERIRYEAGQADKAFVATMEALALAAEYHDPQTAAHLRRIGAYAHLLAEALGCEPRFVKMVSRSAPMHDVGKITIPVELVRKPDLLTADEMTAMRGHTVNGARMLGALAPLAMARSIATSHHESFDGSGYPQGARGEEIPLEARIVKVVDVYDALRTARPYKPAYTHDEALALLRRGDHRVAPAHFDPAILTAFLDHQDEVARIFAAARANDQLRLEGDPLTTNAAPRQDDEG